MKLSLILQAIIALPKILSFIGSLIKAIQNYQEENKRRKFESAMDTVPTSKEEMKDKIEKITSSLP